MRKKNRYMETALKIAFEKYGKTSPNPPVGAVIVRKGRIISSGGTSVYGSDHAEIVAIKKARKSGFTLKGSEMYVTLEPCNHFGKTPPCTEAIIESGISKVYISILDPNPLVTSKGVSRLRKAGISVEVLDEYKLRSASLIRPFKKHVINKKPFVINKCALTLDGRIASKSGDSRWISSEYSRFITHKLRAKIDAIIIGKNTFVTDNPRLNVRYMEFDPSIKEYFKKNRQKILGADNFFVEALLKFDIKDFKDPMRVLIGLPEKVKKDSNIFKDDNYIIFATEKQYKAFKKKEKALNLNIIINKGKAEIEVVNFILSELGSRGIMTAVVEGGSTINGLFLEAGEIDQFFYTITPKIVGNGISPINSSGFNTISEALRLYDVSKLDIKDDLFYIAYKESFSD